MLTIAMIGGKQISPSSQWAERLMKVHNPLCPGMAADNIKIIH